MIPVIVICALISSCGSKVAGREQLASGGLEADDLVPDPDDGYPLSLPDAPPRVLPSSFPPPPPPRVLRFALTTRGLGRMQSEEAERRVADILASHLPQPWELQRTTDKEASSSLENAVTIRVTISYTRKQISRPKRPSKSAPTPVGHVFRIHMASTGKKKARDTERLSWDGWSYDWSYETSGTYGNANVTSKFLDALSGEVPTLTAQEPDGTAAYLRSHGLVMPDKPLRSPATAKTGHGVIAGGCLVTPTPSGRAEIVRLDAQYGRPLKFTRPPDSALCSGDTLYAVSAYSKAESVIVAAKFGTHPERRPVQLWSVGGSFDEPVTDGNHVILNNGRVICLHPGPSSRFTQIICLDSSSGSTLLSSRRYPGPVRGAYLDGDNTVTLITDSQVLSYAIDIGNAPGQPISEPTATAPIATVRTKRPISCQLNNRIIFETAPSLFSAYNTDTGLVDWQAYTFDTRFMHCGRRDTLLLSDSGGVLMAFDVAGSRAMWKFRTPTIPRDALSIDDQIYLLLERAIIVLDRRTGESVAQIPLAYQPNGFITTDKHIYINSNMSIYKIR